MLLFREKFVVCIKYNYSDYFAVWASFTIFLERMVGNLTSRRRSFSVRNEPFKALLRDLAQRPDFIVHDNSASGSRNCIDLITIIIAT